jgi:hypothetical protein
MASEAAALAGATHPLTSKLTHRHTHRFEGTPLQRKKATELQQAWGSKPCDHPAFSREYDLGERTGNYCCTQCGASVTFREKAEITAARTTAPRRPRTS